MKTFKKLSKNRLFLIFLSFSILLLGCSRESSLDTFSEDNSNLIIENNSSFSNLDGETIFRSIFFLENKAIFADIAYFKPVLDVLENQSNEQKLERKIIENEVISKIVRDNPNFMSKFKEQISTNNPFLIQEALKSGAQLLQKVLIKNEDDINQLKKELSNINIKDKKELEGFLQNSLNKEDGLFLANNLSKSLNLNDDIQATDEACFAVAVVVVLAVALAGVAVIASVIVEVVNYPLEESQTANSLITDEIVVKILERN